MTLDDAEANRRALAWAKRATPAEMFALSVRAGIHKPAGGLTPEYGGEPWSIMTSYDHDDDVLTVSREGAVAHGAREGYDHLVLIHLDKWGHAIGADLLEASTFNRVEWLDHPDRAGLPWDVRAAMDEWFEGR